MDKTFTLVGVSTQGKITKFRVANGDVEARVKVLERAGHTEIEFVELSTPMTKIEAIEAYKVDHPDTASLRMPNEKDEKVKATGIRTVSIKKVKLTDAATNLLNAVDATDAVTAGDNVTV